MSNQPEELFLKADQLIGAEDIVGARKLLYQILDEYPDFGRAHNHLGWLNEHKLRYFDKAEEHFKAALRFSPEYPAGWINYGYFLEAQDRFDELLEHYEKMKKVKGISQSLIYNGQGAIAELRGNYTSAIEFYKKAIKHSLNDDNIKLYEQSIARSEKKQQMEL